jgi:hypothetical protein
MMYRGKKRTEVAPHLYAISDNAYSNMLRGEYHRLGIILGCITLENIFMSPSNNMFSNLFD